MGGTRTVGSDTNMRGTASLAQEGSRREEGVLTGVGTCLQSALS